MGALTGTGRSRRVRQGQRVHGAYGRGQIFVRTRWIATFQATAPTVGIAFLTSQVVAAVWVGQRALLPKPDAGQLRMLHGNTHVGLDQSPQIIVGVIGLRRQLLERRIDDLIEKDAQNFVLTCEVPVNGSSSDTSALSYGINASSVKALLVEQIFSGLKNLLLPAHRAIILNNRLQRVPPGAKAHDPIVISSRISFRPKSPRPVIETHDVGLVGTAVSAHQGHALENHPLGGLDQSCAPTLSTGPDARARSPKVSRMLANASALSSASMGGT